MGRRKTIIKEESEESAGNEDIRSALAQIDDTDAWVAEAWRLGVDSIRIHHRAGKSVPQLGELTRDLQEGIGDWAEEHWPPRQTPDGERLIRRYILIAMKTGKIVARTEFSRGDVEDEPWVVAPDTEKIDMDAELARSIKQARVQAWNKSQSGGSDLDNFTKAATLLRPNSDGITAMIGPILQTMASQASASQARADQAMAALIARLDKPEAPGVWAKLLGAMAPAMPDLVGAVFERFTGGPGVMVSDAADLGKLDWISWAKVMIPKTIETYPQIVPAVLSVMQKISGVEVVPQPAIAQPGAPSPQGGAYMPASDRMPAEIRALLEEAIKYYRGVGEDFDPRIGLTMLKDVVRYAAGADWEDELGALLEPKMPDYYTSAKLRLIDQRLADPAIIANIKRVITYDQAEQAKRAHEDAEAE